MWNILLLSALSSLFLHKKIYAADGRTNQAFLHSDHAQVKLLSSSFKKSDKDTYNYRMIELPNGLQALLISDPTAGSSAASVDVGVGHFSDPDEVPGLAHFCEHLLFMGTKKYPGENDFSSFLSAHSGYYNAYTSMENTNYFFQIIHENFEKALDMFSHFFIDPLFSRSAVDREARAVDSENKKNLQSDLWRLFQLEKSLSNPKSPYSKFGTGTYQTLITEPKKKGLDVIEVLLDFHGKYYSSRLMKLVVFSKETLDELQDLVLKYFSGVPDNGSERPVFIEKPLTKKELSQQRWAKPIADMLLIELVFPIDGLSTLYKTGASDYLEYLIEHKASGSIFSLLQTKGWITDIGVSKEYIVSGVEFFRIQLDLTDDGFDNYEDVIVTVFQYIEMIKQSGIPKWVYTELKSIYDLGFRFKDPEPLHRYVSSLSSLMQEKHIAHEDLLSYFIPQEYSKNDILKFLGFLTPKNFILNIVSKTHPGNWDKTEKWYGTQYKVEPLSANITQKLANLSENDLLKLPIENKFIPKTFVIKPKLDKKLDKPYLVFNNTLLRLWMKWDDTFSSPKTYLTLAFQSPKYYLTSRHAAETAVYIDMIYDDLGDLLYYAGVAGNELYIDGYNMGFYLTIYCYTDKVYDLLSAFMDAMLEYYPNPNKFEFYKNKLMSRYSTDITMPYRYLFYYVRHLYNDKSWADYNIFYSLQTLTYSDMISFRIMRFSRVFVEGLALGGLSFAFPGYVKFLLNRLGPVPIYPYQNLPSRIQMLDKGSNYIYEVDLEDPNELNSAVLYSLQLGSAEDSKLLAASQFLLLIAKDPAFTQLRSIEQLGYIVKTALGEHSLYLDYRIMIQSLRDPMYLEQRIIAFLYKLSAMIDAMTEEEFKAHVKTLISLNQRNYRSLRSEALDYWTFILTGTYDFERYLRVNEELTKLKKQDLIDMFRKYIYPISPDRKKLSVHLRSKTLEEVSVRDLSLERLYYFFECKMLKIPYNDLVALLESSNRLSEFKLKLQVYLIEKYPEQNILEFIEYVFEFLKNQYTRIKQRIKKSYDAIHFSDVTAFKSSLRLSSPPFPLSPWEKFYYKRQPTVLGAV
ncbi:uncharacterized protein T551_00903 [Pneumocystis jirovecii RU7]|uniref:Peptidase M16 N-terminal domain-containing protein n=1 Tax=Pneumocystis jirovecii (strain RU7) TaxID=1408657 RepID=A0A0W4ZV13_PNEJ7|nr:uncharacterized protein T551_00903 [Pneumocystis jirovecii RU7]KTW32221.1 hypothetical protein T551_00903 [Pneumocystis jirovecii RU7]